MIGIKFLFDLMAAKIAQIDSDFDWLNSTHKRHSIHISEWRHTTHNCHSPLIFEWQHTYGKLPFDFSEPTDFIALTKR